MKAAIDKGSLLPLLQDILRDKDTVEERLSERHRHKLLVESTLTEGMVLQRMSFTCNDPETLRAIGFSEEQSKLLPALVLPTWGVDGWPVMAQTRPDDPREVNGKIVKYETPAGKGLRLDIHPTAQHLLADPGVPLVVTEGLCTGDSMTQRRYPTISLMGVSARRGRNEFSGVCDLADWNAIALNGRKVYIIFDSDVMRKIQVRRQLVALAEMLRRKECGHILPIIIPEIDGLDKVGMDDWFYRGRGVEEMLRNEARDLIAKNNRPSIVIMGRSVNDVTDDAVAALEFKNDPARVFAYSGNLARVHPDENCKFSIETLGVQGVRYELGQCAEWTARNTKGEMVKKWPPKDLAENVLQVPTLCSTFPPLEGLASAPILGPHNPPRMIHGYDEDSRWFITDRGPWPTWQGTPQEAAQWILDEVFGDFPFAEPSSKCHALALLLLPFVRPIIDGPTPMHFIDAPRRGSGKSMLARAAAYPGLGRMPGVVPIADKEEEFVKTLSTQILQGEQFIFLDNLGTHLRSPFLDACLTSTEVTPRILGFSKMPLMSVRATFTITANNGSMSGDALRRCLWIRIDPKMENPEDREGFKHSPLLHWVKSERKKIVSAAIAICTHWHDTGRPLSIKKKATYEAYSHIMGGILESVGVEGFLDNDRDLVNSTDDENDEWRRFYAMWWERFQGNAIVTAELCAFAIEHKLFSSVFDRCKSEAGKARAFGQALSKKKDVTLNVTLDLGQSVQLAPKLCPKSGGVVRFKMIELGQSGQSPPNQPRACARTGEAGSSDLPTLPSQVQTPGQTPIDFTLPAPYRDSDDAEEVII